MNSYTLDNSQTVNSHLVLDITQIEVLNQTLLLFQERLSVFAQDPEFSQKLVQAFGEAAADSPFQADWRSGQFSLPTSLQILAASELSGALGAFSAQTNTIYLSADLLSQSRVDGIAQVLLEEYGHWIDSQINAVDTTGDEGEIFAALVVGQPIPTQAVNQNDAITLLLDGQVIKAEANTIGSNAFGYTASTATYQAIDLIPGSSGVTTIIDNQDDISVALSLGTNSFNFYGTTYTSLFVSSNGLITFGSSNNAYINTNLSSGVTQAAIAVFWDDLDTRMTTADQVLYQINGNQLIIEWSDVQFYNTVASPITFQAILQLNTGAVPGNFTLNYVDLDNGNAANNNGASATVGIKNASGDPLLVSFNNGSSPYLGSGQAITFISLAPTVSAPAAFTVTEDVAGNLTFSGTPFTDVDSTNLTVTLSIADGAIAGAATTGITIGGTSTARTFSGTTSALNTYFTTAGNVTYTTALNNNTARTLTVSISDGTYSSAATSTVNITPVNDAPTVTAPTSFTVTEDVAGNLTFTGTPFADVDSANLTVTLSITDGAIAGAAAAGITISGTATARTFSGTTAALNTYFTTAGRVTYTTASNNNTARTLTVGVSDGALSTSATSTVNITPVNDAPTVTSPASFTVTEDVAGNLTFTGTPFADVDSTNLTVTLSIADGAIAGVAAAGITIGGTTIARTFSGTTAALNTYFTTAGNVTYTTALNNNTARTLTVGVSDGALNASTTSTINITAVNDPATVTSGATLAYTELAAAATIDTALTVTDPDNANLTGASVTIGNFVAGDVLTFTSANGITGSYNNGTGVLTLSGTTTLANYQTALRSVKFNSTSLDPTVKNTVPSRTITFAANDGAGLVSSGTATINVTATNNAPTVSALASFTVTEDVAGNLTFIGTPFADVDSANLTVTLSIADGAIAGVAAAGITIGGTTIARTFSGTTAALNTYFTTAGNVTYTTALNNNTARTLTVGVSDGALNASATSTINITPVNDPATVTSGATLAYTELAAAAAIDATLLTVTDPDSANLTGASVTIGNFVAGDILTFTAANGITGSYDGAGVLTLSGTTTLANYQTALRSVKFNSTSLDPTVKNTVPSRTITFAANDGAGLVSSGTATINITATNNAPTVTAPASFTVTEDVAGNLTFIGTPFADVDSTNLTVTLSIADGAIIGAAAAGITIGGTTIARTFSGTTAALNTYFTTAGNVTYTTALDNNTARTLTVGVSDGALSASATSTINITPVNDAPTLAAVAPGSLTDTAANDTFATITGTLSGSDPEGSTLTYAIIGSAVGTYGTLGLNTNTGAYTYTPNAAAINALSTNAADNFTFSVSDGSLSTTQSFIINITGANDTPTLAVVTAGSLTDTAANDTFANITGTLAGGDRDAGTILTYGISGGTVASGTSTLVGTFGTLSLNTATGAYTYTPNTTAINALSTNAADNFTFSVSDGSLSTTQSFAVNITGVNDTPTLSAVTAGSLTDTAANDTFANITGTLAGADRDTGTTLTYGIAGGTVASGTSTLVGTYGTLSLNTATGVYTYTPNAAAVNALSTNAADNFTFSVSDGSLSTTQSFAVNITGVNDTPTLAAVTSGSLTDTAANDTFANITGTLAGGDRDTGTTLTYGIAGGTVVSGTSTIVGTYGTLSLNTATGAYTYTPNAAAINALSTNAADNFTFSVSDGSLSTTQSFAVNITGVNDTPTLAAITSGSLTDTAANDTFANITGTLAGGDRDTGTTLTYGIAGGTVVSGTSTIVGTFGTLSLNTATGAYTYTPNAAAINALSTNAADNFTFSVSDGSLSTTQSFAVNITGANDTPTLAAVTSGSLTDTAANDTFANITGTLAGGDRDAGTILTYGIAGGTVASGTSTIVGTYGTLSLNTATGAYTYTPNASAINALSTNAADNFTFSVSDGSLSTTQSFVVNITGVNDTPTLSAVTSGSLTDTAANDTFANITGTLAGADRDTGTTLTYGIAGGTVASGTSTLAGTYGTLSLNTATGAYTYTPDAAAINALSTNAADNFTFSVSDGSLSTTQSFAVNITGANDTPTLAAVTSGSLTDTAANDTFANITGTLAGADRDTGTTLTYGIAGGTVVSGTSTLVGTYGTLTLNTATGAYTYAPNASAINALSTNAADNFTFSVSDGSLSTTQNFAVNITGANDTPTLAAVTSGSLTDTAANDTFANITGTLAGSDRDSGQTLTYGIAGGTVVSGTSTLVGTYGTLSLNTATGAYAYTPNAAAINSLSTNAADNFTFSVSDGSLSTTQSFAVNITGANDTPTLAAVTSGSLTDTAANDTFANITGTLAGADRDAGTILTYGISGGTVASGTSTLVGTFGTLSLNTATGAYTYTPNAFAINALSTNAADNFTFSVSDGSLSTTQSFVVNITGVNDTPTLSAVTSGSLTDTAANDTFANITGTLAGGDRDTGTTLTYGIAGGTVASGTSTLVGTYGTLSLNTATGAYNYTPNAAAINALSTNAADNFTFSVSDGSLSTTQSFAVNITGANDTPTLAAVTSGSLTDTAANDTFANITGTLAGSDRDTGTTLTYGIAGGTVVSGTSTLVGTYGTLTLNTATGAYTYTPNATAVNALSTNAADNFTFSVSDGSLSTTQNFAVNITGANDTPTLAAVTSGSLTDTAANDTFDNITGTLAGSDRDSGQTLTYGIQGGTVASGTSTLVGTYGTLSVNTTSGAYTYTPNSTAINALTSNASDNFTFTFSDGVTSVSQGFAVNITGANDTPTLAAVTSGIYTDTTANDTFSNITGTLSGSDRDSGQTLTYGIQGGTLASGTSTLAGTYGTLSVNTTSGAYTYTPNSTAINALTSNASDSFTFTVSDGSLSTTQSFAINITGANDAPTVTAISSTASEDAASYTLNLLAGAADADTSNTLSVTGYTPSIDSGTLPVGALSLSGSTLSVDPNAFNFLAAGEQRIVTVSYNVFDGTASTANTATITITGENDAPTITAGTQSAQLVEAGGVANGTPGTDSATITLTKGDVDGTANYDTTYLTNNSWSTADSGLTYTKTGTYGTATLTLATGVVAYALNNSSTATQALTQGQSVTDSFTIQVTDGTATALTNAVFSVTGANDAAGITGASTGAVTEAGGVNNGTAGTPTVTGDLNSTDVDNTADAWTEVTTATNSSNGYGTYTLTNAGVWTYNLNNSNATVQALNSGQTLTDTFTAQTVDGTSQTVTITITGANDVPTIAGETTGDLSVTEDTDLSASGTLTIVDADAGQSNFTAATSVATLYGTYSLAANGNWTYTLNNSLSAVQALGAGSTITDSFTAVSSDSTASKTVSITIAGTNDAPVLTPSGTALVYTKNAAAAAINSTLTVSDVDSTTLTAATVSITSGLTTGDVLGFTTQNGITGTYNSSTGVLTLSGTATVAQYQTALRSVTYSSTSDNPTATSASRTISWQVNDGFAANNLSTVATSTINVTAVNNAPTVTNISVTETQIVFTASDVDTPTLSLNSTFAAAFNNPTINNRTPTTLTPNLQTSPVSGTLQVTDGLATASVICLMLGTINGDSLTASSSQTALYGFDGNDSLTGGAASDYIFGGAGNDTLTGGAGSDRLYGGDDNDILYGGDDNDNLYGDAGNDNLYGEAGSDALYGGMGDDSLDGGDGNDILNGDAGNDILIGGLGADRLNGGDDNDILYGGNDNDILYGDAGADTLYGEAGSDNLYGGLGNDSLDGGDGNDILNGDAGNDILFGGLGGDRLNGGDGNDTLNGGDGNDILNGGLGNDIFLFAGTSFLSIGNDTIQDFAVANDKIQLSKSTFSALASLNALTANNFSIVTNDANASIGTGAIVYNSVNGNLFYNSNLAAIGFGDGGQFAKLSTGLTVANLTSVFELVA